MQVRVRTFVDGVAHVPACGNQLRTSCTAVCPTDSAFNYLLEEAKNPKSDTEHSTYQFHLFLWSAVLSWIGMAVVVSIADAICFDLLGSCRAAFRKTNVTIEFNVFYFFLTNHVRLGHERRNDYGKQKMWGSIGFGVFGISAGYMVDFFSKRQHEKDYTCIFYIMLISMIGDILVSATLKKVRKTRPL